MIPLIALVFSQLLEFLPRTHKTHPQASFQQKRLWFIAQLEGGNEAYHILEAVEFRGELLVAMDAADVGPDTAVAQFDLTLSLVAGVDGLAGKFEYATDLFVEATVQRWAGY